jgi:hypothetical protein
VTITAPTRITIEVHPAGDAGADGAATPAMVRVVPDAPSPARQVFAGAPREEMPAPAAYDPGECRCLDDEDCGADHAND